MFRALPYLNWPRRVQGPDGVSSRRVDGHLQRPHLRRGMPGGNLNDPVKGVAAHPRLQPPVHVRETPARVVLRVLQQSHLGPRLPGEAGQREGHVLDGQVRRIGLHPAPDGGRRPLPCSGRFPERDGLLPGRPARRRAQECCRAHVSALHFRPGVRPSEKRVDRDEEGLEGGGGERQRGALDYRLVERQGNDGSVVHAVAESPCPAAFTSEPVDERVFSHGCEIPHRAQSESAHLGLHVGGRREAG